MNEELLEYYSNIFIEARAEERYTPFIRMLYNLLELGYGERYFSKIYDMEIDDVVSSVSVLERMVVDCLYTELKKLGIEIDAEATYNKPTGASLLLDFILEGLENTEESEMVYNILCSELRNVDKLDTAVKAVYDVPEHVDLSDILISVDERFMIILLNSIEMILNDLEESQGSEEVSDVELAYRRRMALYLKRFPQNPETSVFYNTDPKANIEVLYDTLSYEHDEFQPEELCAIYTAGLTVMVSSTYNEAYGKAHEILERIQPDDDVNPLVVLSTVNVALKDIYSSYAELYTEGVDDEQDTVS